MGLFLESTLGFKLMPLLEIQKKAPSGRQLQKEEITRLVVCAQRKYLGPSV